MSARKFEQLPNELILMCFIYLDFYTLYEIFFNLSQRFTRLIKFQTKIRIDLSSTPSSKFLTFFLQLNEFMKSNEHYPLAIVAQRIHKLHLLIEDELFLETFSKLKSLTLSNMDCKTINTMIFNSPTKLYQSLERLSLLDDITQIHFGLQNDKEDLCANLISSKMQSLKYLKLNFQELHCECDHYYYSERNCVHIDFRELTVGEHSLSNIETLIIGYGTDKYSQTNLLFNALSETLLPCLPKLQTLLINSIYFDGYPRLKGERTFSSITEPTRMMPANLKCIKITIESDDMDRGGTEAAIQYLRNFFLDNKSSSTTTVKKLDINNRNFL